MRTGLRSLLVIVGLALATLVSPLHAVAGEPCVRTDFETVVGQAAEALKALNQTNKPAFQVKLRQLKAKRGWTQDQFLAAAAPMVQDASIARFDTETTDVLARIERLGAEGVAASEPDCSRLADVRLAMAALVKVQQAKWTYMNERIDAELAR